MNKVRIALKYSVEKKFFLLRLTAKIRTHSSFVFKGCLSGLLYSSYICMQKKNPYAAVVKTWSKRDCSAFCLNIT